MVKADAKILLTDDSTFMRSVLKNILQNDGYKNFIEAENGAQALEKISQEKPDLILLDIIMPEIGGIEVLKQIGQQEKVLVISAVGQEKIIEEAMGLGAKGYVVKPFDNNQVLTEVNRVLV